MLPHPYGQLPTDGFVTASLQDELLVAFAELAREHGYARVRAADVAARVGCAPAEFTSRFPTNEDCVLAMIDAGVKRVMAVGAAAYVRAPQGWAHASYLALRAMLEALAAEPATLHVVLVEGPSAGPRAARLLRAAPRNFTLFFRPGYEEASRARDLPPLRALTGMAVGGAVAMIRQYALDGRERDIPELAPAIGLVGLSPLVGRDEALRVIAECEALRQVDPAG